MNAKEIALSKQELISYSLSQSDSNLVFDFSRIPNKQSDKVLATLIRESKNGVRALTLCLDSYYEFYDLTSSFKPNFRTLQAVKHEPSSLANSAFRRDKTAIQSIVIALKYILSRAQCLEHLGFRNIPFDSRQLVEIGKSLEKSVSLKSLSFDNVQLYDDGFTIIAKSIRKLKMVRLECRNCNLTDSSSASIKMLLNYYSVNSVGTRRSKKTSKVEFTDNMSFQVLDLRYNSFSYRLLLEIGDVLSIVPLKVLDIRYNQLIDSKIASNMKSAIHGLDVRVNSQQTSRMGYQDGFF
ncbi:hypothetical protein M9Y10_008272 [Tritrichomonas musculus]|uniref:Leucine Rich Repeat family protein n=1 Tax=Tritrichomonas musculus TaxID=1915356 RepID=A0ABR2IYP2_9EUKA